MCVRPILAQLGLGGGLDGELELFEGGAMLALGLGGIFTGLIAAGLSEVLSVLPHTMFTFHLEDDARPLMIAVCIGKTVGALLAMYLGI